MSGDTEETAPPGVYLGPYNHIGSHKNHGSDVWAVDTNKVRLNPDPADHNNYWGFHYSEQDIPRDAMHLVHKGKRAR